MGASATLERKNINDAPLAVEPGGQTSVTMRVRNNGHVVDELTFEPLGPAAAWIEIEPAAVPLFPGAEATVTIRFVPPRSPDVAPGQTPFAVRVRSREDPAGSVAEEGVIVVGRFEQRAVELYPPTARGRRGGRYEVAIDNRGNAPLQVQLAGTDPEQACRYDPRPSSLPVGPGAAAYAKLRVAPAKRFWKGPPKTHQFQVIVTQDGHDPELVNGTYLQEAMLPPWIVKAFLLTAALLLVLFILWQTLFKSTVESAARDAVAEPIASIAARVEAIAPASTAAPDGASSTTVAGETNGADAGTDASGATTTTLDPSATGIGASDPSATTTTVVGASAFPTAFGDPIDFQLSGTVAGGATQTFTQTFTKSFALTDFVLQNPGGDAGSVQVMRNGAVLKVSALENFRDYDLHFVAPFVFKPGDSLVLSVACTVPGPANTSGCSISGSFSGFEK